MCGARLGPGGRGVCAGRCPFWNHKRQERGAQPHPPDTASRAHVRDRRSVTTRQPDLRGPRPRTRSVPPAPLPAAPHARRRRGPLCVQGRVPASLEASEVGAPVPDGSARGPSPSSTLTGRVPAGPTQPASPGAVIAVAPGGLNLTPAVWGPKPLVYQPPWACLVPAQV